MAAGGQRESIRNIDRAGGVTHLDGDACDVIPVVVLRQRDVEEKQRQQRRFFSPRERRPILTLSRKVRLVGRKSPTGASSRQEFPYMDFGFHTLVNKHESSINHINCLQASMDQLSRISQQQQSKSLTELILLASLVRHEGPT